jgi:MFS family permease
MHIPPSLRHRQFAVFWTGIAFSWFANQVLVWAIPWHIRDFTDNPFALGAIGLIRLIPLVLASLFAGVVADRFSRRKVVFITQSTMGLVALTLALLTFTGKVELWLIYALLAVQSTAYVFDLPARYSITPNIVPVHVLPNALSVEFLGVQVGGLLGPVFSGFLINRFGQASAYFGSAILFGVMLIALISMGKVPQRKLQSASPGVGWAPSIDWGAIKEGIVFTFRHPLIFSGMLLDFLATLLTRADSLMPYFARDVLGLNALQYGWLSAASAIGATIAGLTVSQLRQIRNQGRTLLISVGLIGIAAMIFGFSRSFPLSMAALMLAGASDSVSSIIRSAIRQLHTPDDLRGRMTSVNQIFFMGGPYLGDVKSGFLGGLIGVPLAVALGGAACLVSVGWIARQWPGLRRYDGVEEVKV